MAKRKGRKYWLAVIRRFEDGEMSQSTFCSRHKLNIGTFRAWLYRLRSEGVSIKRKKRARFHEVKSEMPGPSSAGQCILRVGQVEVEFRELPSTDYLSEVASGLRYARQ